MGHVNVRTRRGWLLARFSEFACTCKTELGAGLERRLVGGRIKSGRAVAKEKTERENDLPFGPFAPCVGGRVCGGGQNGPRPYST